MSSRNRVNRLWLRPRRLSLVMRGLKPREQVRALAASRGV